jgi:hypothetical protein
MVRNDMSQNSSIALIKSLIYLDTGYFADLYEVTTGESPKTQITRNQGSKAGVKIPVFSAEVNSQETRSFSLSTIGMLHATIEQLKQEVELDFDSFVSGMPSKYGWVEGELTVFQISSSSTERDTGKTIVTASDDLFQIRRQSEIDLALITTPEYFMVGLGTFVKLQKTLIKEMSIPIRAYVRVMGATSHMKQWVAVPLLILERADD